MIVSFFLFPALAVLAGCVVTCVVLWLLQPLILVPRNGATKVRIISILSIFSLAGSHSLWGDLVNTAAKALGSDPAIVHRFPWIANIEFGSEPSVTVLIFAAIGLFIVNNFMTDKSIGGGHPVPLKKDFPEPNIQSKLDSFCSALRQHLETTDRQTNWSPDYYTELEAEVEIVPIGGGSAKKRIVDLQTALRSDRRTQAFLVLGDPGGGKSVALRKLARDMLGEVRSTGRIPLYVNLREWLPIGGRRATAWTEQAPPTMQELEAFILDTIKARGDVFTEEFVDTYFRDLWQHGRLFFIFDSFDEIPELLDASEESWLINCLSDLLSRFITTNVNARGVLASRMFRRPTHAFLAQKILDIRPMSEERIQLALARYPAFTRELQNRLFRDRHDLVPIARNPFLMALLGEWVNNHRDLPGNQGDLYKNYLHMRLSKVQTKIEKNGLTAQDVLNSATQIAEFVFNSTAYGLEAPVSVLQNEHTIANANETIDILNYARIARVTSGDSISFAFVHRRFLEYLVTTRMLEEPGNLPLDHIPTDSRGRDAMVLYAQLCDDAIAERLARLCWKEICDHFKNTETQLRAIHSLRFLIDAFRSRRMAVASFADALEIFITENVTEQGGLIQAKICLEAAGLLKDDDAVPILQLALSGKNDWLRETAFRACRHLPKISLKLQQLINAYLINMPVQQFWSYRRTLIFSLGLSDSLREARQIAIWRKRNLLASICALVLGGILAPGLAIIAGLSVLSFLFIDNLGNSMINRVKDSKRKTLNTVNFRLYSDSSIIRTYQHLFGIGLLTVVLSLLGVISAKNFVRDISTSSFFSTQYANKPEMMAMLLTVVALLSFDWLLIGSLKKVFQEIMALTLNNRVKFLFRVIRILIATGVLFLCVNWLLEQLSTWIKTVFMSIFIAMSAFTILMSLFLEARDYLRDWFVFRRIVISASMSRQQIVQNVNSLVGHGLRLAVVRKIAERKTVATGDWPDEFKFSISSDPVITELAKLEERWLKLDR